MSGVFSFLATILVLIILLSPFLFFSINTAVILTFFLGMVLSFILGGYVGKLSGDIPTLFVLTFIPLFLLYSLL